MSTAQNKRNRKAKAKALIVAIKAISVVRNAQAQLKDAAIARHSAWTQCAGQWEDSRRYLKAEELENIKASWRELYRLDPRACRKAEKLCYCSWDFPENSIWD